MRVHYAGHGMLVQDGKQIDLVDYDFDIHSEFGIRGQLWSVDQFLPRVTTFRLRLEDREHYVVVWLSSGILDVLKMQYRYMLYAAPDQPDDLNNLAPKQHGQHP